MKNGQQQAAELRALMAEHDLTQAEVAQFSGFAKRTIEGWLANPGAATSRNFSQRNLDIIKLYLQTYLANRTEAPVED